MNLRHALRYSLITSALIAPALCSSDASAQVARPAPQHGHDMVVLIDMTGSMLTEENLPGGRTTRFEAAKTKAISWLRMQPKTNQDIGQPPQGPIVASEVSVWTFSGTGYEQVLDFTTDFALAELTISNLQITDPGARTPLAVSMCDVSEALRDHNANDLLTRNHLFIATDGGENNTPRHDRCYGPDTDDLGGYPFYTPQSWQWRVRNMLIEADPQIEPVPLNKRGKIIVDVAFIMNYSLTTPYSAAKSLDGSTGLQEVLEASEESSYAGYRGSQSRRARARNTGTVATDIEFFRSLATASGGTFEQVGKDDSSQDDTPKTRSTDLNGDGCVDNRDVDLFFQIVADHGTTSMATITRCDLNNDGLVNNFDYLKISREFGRGCPLR